MAVKTNGVHIDVSCVFPTTSCQNKVRPPTREISVVSMTTPADSVSTWRWMTGAECLCWFIRGGSTISPSPPSSHQLISRDNTSRTRSSCRDWNVYCAHIYTCHGRNTTEKLNVDTWTVSEQTQSTQNQKDWRLCSEADRGYKVGDSGEWSGGGPLDTFTEGEVGQNQTKMNSTSTTAHQIQLCHHSAQRRGKEIRWMLGGGSQWTSVVFLFPYTWRTTCEFSSHHSLISSAHNWFTVLLDQKHFSVHVHVQ